MAVVMVAGNQPRMPQGILKGVRTMTANIVTEMGYATGLHREALIATASGLCVAIISLCFHAYFTHRMDNIITNAERCATALLQAERRCAHK